MSKAYLAHSSKQKNFVEQVASKLGVANCIYDAVSFELGMKTMDEIFTGLEATDLFVLFLSDTALESPWVKRELALASEFLQRGTIKRIFPIIIDNITHSDPRIPEWIRDEYNLKFVAKPSIAVQRIKQALREITWTMHPKLKESSTIFVGRNELVNSFEERIDNFDMVTPTTLIASGLPHVGRRTLLKYCLIKTNLVRETYTPSLMTLKMDARALKIIF